ncbi:MAG: hypothetical protein JEY94_05900 [Melioribacteraceae bacterium]|nr:hypothetical protein [Melioribacteraceae bacterium]
MVIVKKNQKKSNYSLLILLITAVLNLFYGCSEDSNVVDSGKNGSSIEYSEPTRLLGSPYPASSKPDTLYIIEDPNFTDSQLITIQSLQGLLAQTKPRIYRLSPGSYSDWLYDLKSNYGVKTIYTYSADFEGLLKHFKNEIDGYILTKPGQTSIHYAFSLAGLVNSIVVLDNDEAIIKETGISLTEDVRNKPYEDFITRYGDQVNKDFLCYQTASKAKFLSDYAVFGKGFFFYDGIRSSLTSKVFSEMNNNAVLLGWGTSEDQLVEVASSNAIIVDAADWVVNLSTLSNFGVDTKQLNYNNNPDVLEKVHTVCFLMTDGDNIQWTVGGFKEGSNWYGSPNRKKANIGWTMAPALTELAPTVLKKFYDTAGREKGGKDYFVAGPSGMGYIFPDQYSDLENFAVKTAEYMKKADMRILNIIGTTVKEDYLKPFLEQEQIDAIFFYYYYSYVGGEGNIYWVNDKPVITGRYQLWGGEFDGPETLADKINIMSKDITYSKAYSLIPVHVWTESVDDVLTTINHFDDNVRVVTPDEFVALIRKNIQH